MAMDFSALNNPKDVKPLKLSTVLLAVGLAAADATITGPYPFPGSSYITVPLASWAVIKYFRQRGLDIKDAPIRNNPVVLGTAILGASAAAVGVTAAGIAAYYAYNRYVAASEREDARLAVEQDPVLSFVNPTIGAATGAAVAYATGRSVWKSGLYGAFFGLALRRLAIEVILTRSKVR